jgi:hypothetical protein
MNCFIPFAYEPAHACKHERALQGRFPPPPPKLKRHPVLSDGVLILIAVCWNRSRVPHERAGALDTKHCIRAVTHAFLLLEHMTDIFARTGGQQIF